MIIIERGPCKKWAASLSPIKPWGVLLHTTEGGSKSSLDDLFINCRRYDGIVDGRPHYTTVSVHFAIYSDGEIRAYAPWKPGKAWYTYHAGKSYLDGQSGVSRVLIGIEIQHRQGQQYPRVQLDALKGLLADIQAAYRGEPYWRNVLTEHSIVAPGRKIDPTEPWNKIKAEVYAAWEGEQDMTPEQDKMLRQLVLSEYARSFDVRILEAKIDGHEDVVAEMRRAKEEAVANRRKELKL